MLSHAMSSFACLKLVSFLESSTRTIAAALQKFCSSPEGLCAVTSRDGRMRDVVPRNHPVRVDGQVGLKRPFPSGLAADHHHGFALGEVDRDLTLPDKSR
jgi:hypothetical protein